MLRKGIGLGLLLAIAGCGSVPRIVVLNDPLTAPEHANLGMIYEARGDPIEAEKAYRAALDKEPGYVPALAGLGNLLAQRGEYRPAEEYYRRALRREPDHPMVNNNLAWIYIHQGIRLNEADEMINRALDRDPEHRAFYLDTRARLLLRQGLLDQARLVAIEAERAAGADRPEFREQHSLTLTQMEEAHRSEIPNPTGHP